MRPNMIHPMRRQAFTLIELMVVIGIIALLVGILIPVASGVRRRGYEVRTRALVAKIAAGCHAYYGDWKAYPGIIDEPQVWSATNQNNNAPTLGPGGPQLTGAAFVTSSENLVLSLLGGVAVQNNQFVFPTDSSSMPPKALLVKTGPQSLNLADPKQYQAYIEVQQAELSSGQFGSDDSVIPEFIDGYQDPKPILYMRARNGAQGIVNAKAYSPPDNSDPKYQDPQFDAGQLVPYVTNSVTFKGFKSWADYFRNPGLTQIDDKGNVAGNTEVSRGKDSFILLSAGTDRQWFSADDIISGD